MALFGFFIVIIPLALWHPQKPGLMPYAVTVIVAQGGTSIAFVGVACPPHKFPGLRYVYDPAADEPTTLR
jgi:hypothetical protein